MTMRCLPVCQGHLKIKFGEGHLDDFVKVTDEGVEYAGEVGGVGTGVVGRFEGAMRTTAAFENEALARCQVFKS